MDFDLASLLANTRTWLRGRDPSGLEGDPALFRTGRAGAFHNGVSRLAGADLDAVLGDVRDRLAGVPWSWWCGDDSRPGLAGELTARGFKPALEMPVMAARLDGPLPGEFPAGLTIEEVVSGESLAEWTRVYMAAMVSEPEDFGTVLGSEQHRSDAPGTYRRFLGRVGGRGVATAALMLTGEVAGLYVVGVDPVARRNGYGTAMSAAALEAAQASGATVATLQARSAAQPIYERLGFVTVSRYRLFLP
jgi:GNAT superfamily N-acetyltransferase